MLKTLATLLLVLTASAAAAQAPDDVARVDLLAGWRQPDGTHMAGLRIALAPGWKTYWRAPGEAGIPPRFDWSGSSNLAAARTHWPVPDTFTTNGFRSIGYGGVVVLPLAMRPGQPGQDIALRGTVELGVCETVCLPLTVRVAGTLPAARRQADPAISAALADVPAPAALAGLQSVDCGIAPIADGLRLRATIRMPELGPGEATVIELPDPAIWVSEVETQRRGGTLTASADLVAPHGGPFALDRSSLRFTILSDGRAVEFRGCPSG